MNLTDADRIWFEQQKQAVLENDDVRVVALNNDYDQFRDRAGEVRRGRDHRPSPGQRHALQRLTSRSPASAKQLLDYLGGAYEEIRSNPPDAGAI